MPPKFFSSSCSSIASIMKLSSSLRLADASGCKLPRSTHMLDLSPPAVSINSDEGRVRHNANILPFLLPPLFCLWPFSTFLGLFPSLIPVYYPALILSQTLFGEALVAGTAMGSLQLLQAMETQ
ncbi:hypothetical protein CDL15_Pgr026686 [Punica granatum]|uniref:Uncharacterized protein n=1 Tax=Punica granatum TaxID=22663 RepID=A0A218WL75_PUNGR|nr:hypothetical protein CDL15_Pgr026686 [Punica granatum]